MLLNEHGDPSFLFPNLNSYNINNQVAKFEKNLIVGFISVSRMTLLSMWKIRKRISQLSPFDYATCQHPRQVGG